MKIGYPSCSKSRPLPNYQGPPARLEAPSLWPLALSSLEPIKPIASPFSSPPSGTRFLCGRVQETIDSEYFRDHKNACSTTTKSYLRKPASRSALHLALVFASPPPPPAGGRACYIHPAASRPGSLPGMPVCRARPIRAASAVLPPGPTRTPHGAYIQLLANAGREPSAAKGPAPAQVCGTATGTGWRGTCAGICRDGWQIGVWSLGAGRRAGGRVQGGPRAGDHLLGGRGGVGRSRARTRG